MKKILSLILAAAVVLAVTAGISAKSLQSSPSRTIGVDGSISADEWGAPAFSGDKETCWAKNATYGWDFWQNTTAVAGQYFNIYFTKDENYAYIGVELIGAAGPDSGAATVGDLWAHAHMAFTLSAYDAATTVPRITFQGQTYEQYGYWMIGLLGGTTKAMESKSQGMDTYNLQSSEYAVAYHAATSTYVYEVAVPWSATNIDPDEHSAVVLSVDLADAYTTTSGNRYLICPAAQQAGNYLGPNNFRHAASDPLVISLVDTKVGNTASPVPAEITLDGTVTDTEWGEPMIVTSPEHCQQTWGNYWEFDPAAAPAGQSAKLYVTNDADYIYLAFVLDKCTLDTSCTDAGQLWKAAHFGFTLSKYDANTTMPRITYQGQAYEQYNSFIMGFVNGTKAARNDTQGIVAWDLPDDYYAVAFDAQTGTYTYEVKIPYGRTNIDLAVSRDIALSVSAGQNYTGGAGTNRYNITTGYANSGGPANFAHQNNALKVTLNDALRDNGDYAASAAPPAVILDGTVTAAEWGEPTIVTSPAHCQQTWGNYWAFDPESVNPAQSAKLYIMNDTENLYLAFVLDNCTLDTSCTDPGQLWKAAHFGFSVSQYSENTTVQRIAYNGQNFEQYTSFMIGLVNGTKTATCSTQGLDAWALPADHYAVAFDAEAGTYTYEVKIPFSRTNINYSENRDIAISVSAGQQYTGGAGTNRYNLTTGFAFSGGPDNFQHLHNAIKVTLSNISKVVNPYVRNVAPPLESVVILDGYISDAEWGEPVVVTAPGHCQDTWGNYWEFDPASVSPTQTVKLYLTSDHEYLYVGAVIDECEYDGTCTDKSMLYKAAHFNFSVSNYNENTTVERIVFQGQTYEQYTGFMFGFVNGQKTSYAFTQGIDLWELPGANYEIRYDPIQKTYTYEVKLPMVQTNILTDRIALSASVGSHYTGGEATNRFNLTTGAATCGGPGNWAHLNNALVFELSPNPPTGDAPLTATLAAAVLSAAGAAALLLRKRNRA